MSFILDALRKSEHARARGALPELAATPVARGASSRLPWILAGVGALFVVNLVVLAWVVTRPAPPASVSAASAPRPAAAPARPAPARMAPPAPVRPLTGEADAAADPELERAPPARAAPRAPAAASHEARAAAAPPVGEARRVAAAPAVDAAPPSIHELPAQATAGLATLNIDLHVYSGDAAQRFVIINGQRLHEGAQLKEGPTLEQITPDGAILYYQGTRFLLPRK